MAASQYRDLNIEFRLQPRAVIAENLVGQGVTANLLLNGALGKPQIAYQLNAARLGFGETVVEGLRAAGLVTVGADRTIVPVIARARRVSGLNAAAGGLAQ